MFGAIGIILSASKPTSALAEELYPWCIQSDTLHCDYMTREQCEEAVDYHGFCVPLTDRDDLVRSLARNAYQVGNSIRRQCQNDVVPSSEQGFIVGVTKA